MPERTDQREKLTTALAEFGNKPVTDAARHLFATLGYKSDRRLPITTPAQFRAQLDPTGRLTDRENATLGDLLSLHLLFQLSDAELTAHGDLFDDPSAVQTTKIESYLFFVADLPPGHYTRTTLSTLVRAVNKPLPMPALVLFRHGEAISIGIIHRRLHRRDQSKDVLEKVTLIKDIACADPIRAHIEILNDFALENLDEEFGVPNFVALHEAWQKRLAAYALSNDFYREIADWYFWAHHQVDDGTIRLPQHCDTEEERSLFLIRLLTRVIFCWFLVEKRLIPTDLFRQNRLRNLLKEFSPTKDPARPDKAPTYYRTILQNLFFGTLNMPPEQRAFRAKRKPGEKYDQNYGITNLWRYESTFRNATDWLELARRIPFLNGGLFDCLDDKTGKKKDNFILDGFSDREDFGCHLPNDLFFGPERTVDLSRDYGEEDRRTARSKRAKVSGLIAILSRYKFTIEENTPLEEEIALDPELLGKVFENLLASYNEDTRTTARKALGAFYTPREIVSYMVDEALKSYLGTQVPRCKAALEDLFSNKATLKEIRPETRDALIAAIGRVKILDPACGSGAFPMGALHRLVDLLQKLDPNNESWKRDRLTEARRYRDMLEQAGAPCDELTACDGRIADIAKSFDTRFHALDYARKLYLIENSIYGVDIQPIATQIAKLRFFISLVVDQKVNPQAPNLGVRPLPNLETRIVAADTLTPLPKSEMRQGNLFDDATPEQYKEHERLKQELARVRHAHFDARDPRRKRELRDEDAAIREQLRALLQKVGMPAKAARAMAAWDPYDQNTHAPFFDSEWMFGIPIGKVRIEANTPATLLGHFTLVNDVAGQTELAATSLREVESGFDVVVGNPPYVRQEQLTEHKQHFERNYRSYDGRADLFVYFYEAAIRHLKTTGVLTFISSNKWLRAKYGRPLRAFLSQHCLPKTLIDFGELPVFSAATFPMVFIGMRDCHTECVFVQVPSLNDPYPDIKQVVAKYGVCLTTEQREAEIWNFAGNTDANILAAIAKAAHRIPAENIMAGIKTGLNEAFWLNAQERRDILHQDKTVCQYIKPMLVGDDIRRFRTKELSRWLIYTPIGTDLKKLGPIRAHLSAWKERLENRALDQAWYELQQAQQRYCRMFERPKIVYPDIAMEPRFTLDKEGRYLDMTAFAIADNSKALLAILNSKVVWFFLKRTAAVLGDADNRGRLRLKRQYIERIPIATPLPHQSPYMEMLCAILMEVNRRIKQDDDNQSSRDPLMLAYWEQILNGLVYELYFPEELHTAGLNLFDLVRNVGLPSIDSFPASDYLSHLRSLFETIYDGAHPLRSALSQLQTLDTVRIIEGKA
jgi:hypothetical protein